MPHLRHNLQVFQVSPENKKEADGLLWWDDKGWFRPYREQAYLALLSIFELWLHPSLVLLF